jgi:hypothetical protein
MFNSIATGLKMDVPRSFILLFFSILVMSVYAVFTLVTTSNPIRLFIYIPVFIYFLHYLKAWKLYKDFKTILNTSDSMSSFSNDYENYIKRDDYIKFRKVIFLLAGWATGDLIFILIDAFK